MSEGWLIDLLSHPLDCMRILINRDDLCLAFAHQFEVCDLQPLFNT
ncbi:MAG: Uncharacterised protein [Prochlorococcus marinus str. MIT 9313]|nr:MAG: Uncharacterised protein [Prochlorococcus marinus str. MIT 9313]